MFSCSSGVLQKSNENENERIQTVMEIISSLDHGELINMSSWVIDEHTEPNKYIDDKFDTIVIAKFKESYLYALNGIITEGLIKDNDVNPYKNFKIGDNKDIIESQISDLTEKLNPDLIEGPIARYYDNKLILSSSIEQTETLTFEFENKALKSIDIYVYYE
jgi:hypothetical protein